MSRDVTTAFGTLGLGGLRLVGRHVVELECRVLDGCSVLGGGTCVVKDLLLRWDDELNL